MKNKITVKIQKRDDEWQAIVRVNGIIDEKKTYFSGGDTKSHKQDAEATAKLMLNQLTRSPDEKFVVQSITRGEIYDALSLLLEDEDTDVELKLEMLTPEICQEYATRIGDFTPRGDDDYADKVAEIGQDVLSTMGIKLDGEGE